MQDPVLDVDRVGGRPCLPPLAIRPDCPVQGVELLIEDTAIALACDGARLRLWTQALRESLRRMTVADGSHAEKAAALRVAAGIADTPSVSERGRGGCEADGQDAGKCEETSRGCGVRMERGSLRSLNDVADRRPAKDWS